MQDFEICRELWILLLKSLLLSVFDRVCGLFLINKRFLKDLRKEILMNQNEWVPLATGLAPRIHLGKLEHLGSHPRPTRSVGRQPGPPGCHGVSLRVGAALLSAEALTSTLPLLTRPELPFYRKGLGEEFNPVGRFSESDPVLSQ